MIRELDYGFDFLKTLSQKIGDLAGFVPMCRELIQNADDENCDWISFHFTHESLIVRNPSVFDPTDFDNIIKIGSEGKIDEVEKTGRFGVGFVSVFQICDHPVVRSNNTELIIYPEKQKATQKELTETEGTEIQLDWAREESDVRKGLKRTVINDDYIKNAIDELIESLPNSLLFLRYVREIKLVLNNEPIIAKRLKDQEHLRTIEIFIGDKKEKESNWMVFEEGKTEVFEISQVKRSNRIGVAYPLFKDQQKDFNGFVYCTLPTRTPTGLPIHVNGDFAIKSDRASIIDEGESPEVSWNQKLILRLGDLYVDAIMEARGLIEDIEYADLLPPETYKNPACQSLEGISNRFFETAQDKGIIKIVEKNEQNQSTNWVVPEKARLISFEKNQILFGCLSIIGTPLVVNALQKRWNLLSQKLNVKSFTLRDLPDLLIESGIHSGIEVSSIQNIFCENNQIEPIWSFIESELKRNKTEEFIQIASNISICPCMDGKCRPFFECIVLKPDILDAFPFLDEQYPLATDDFIEKHPFLCTQLCINRDLDIIIETIKGKKSSEISDIVNNNQINLKSFYDCLDARKRKIHIDVKLKNDLAHLEVYPASQSDVYRSINQLFLPGNFNDPIGLDIIIDSTKVDYSHIASFKSLGLKELTIIEYVRRLASTYFQDYLIFGPEDKRIEFLDVTRKHLPDIEQEEGLLQSLTAEKCILCADGNYHHPTDVYLECDELQEVFKSYPYPSKKYGEPLNNSWFEFFVKLGANKKPKIADVIIEIRTATSLPFQEGLPLIEKMFYYLAKHYSEMTEKEIESIGQLRHMEWLPVADEEEYELPENIYLWSLAKLVGRQGKLLRFKRERDFAREFRKIIGLKERPDAKVIINNLRDLKNRNETPDLYIYRELNNKVSDLTEAERDILSKESLLFVYSNQVFVEGYKVYWGPHPFGKYRYEIDHGLKEFQRLIQEIMGVKSEINDQDYFNVIIEIGEADTYHRQFKEDDVNLIRLIYAHLSNKLTTKSEEERQEIENEWQDIAQGKNIVLTRSKQLRPPKVCFFADKEWAISLFKEKISRELVDKDPQTWPFLNAIGVRLLSSAVEVEKFTEPSDIRVSSIQEVLRSKHRQKELKRIIETHKQINPLQHWKFDTVLNMEVTECDELEVEFSITVNGNKITSEIQHPDSHFSIETSNLYILDNLPKEVKLLETSRKIANILNSEIDPVILCSSIRYIIDPELKDNKVHDYLTYMGVDTLFEGEIPKTNWDTGSKGEVGSIFDDGNDGGTTSEDNGSNTGNGSSDTGEKNTSKRSSGSGSKSDEEPEIVADDVAQKRKKYFDEKRKQFYKDRYDFENSQPMPEEPIKKDMSDEEWAEHKHLVMVFYNRQIRNIQRRLNKLQSGIESYDIYSNEWDEISHAIRERDGFKCRRCGATIEELKVIGSYLTVHHIIPRKKGGSNWPSNLITLCIACHREVESAPELL